ncbi:hypothetical protein POM88_047469 [Heracleum sosnowskyi]|uniref:Thioredoxin-like protein n=1 Tax=Heracleum sosnowskyi TaxID=360622 RepID=A0AAD8LZJ3_9APIA|nr:hypothetical protein POM88_047469 [Heracleum sosnowskyi]
MLNIGDGKTNWKGKGILKTTGGRPVICKHSEKSNKRKIIDEEENSSKLIKRRRKLNYLGNRMSKLVQNALYRKRKTNNIDDQNNKLNYLVSKIVRNESCRKRKTNDVGNKSSKKKKNNNDLDQHICTRTIQIGDTLNLSDLLFTKKRNYLFNYKLNKRVRAKDLAGSVVVLYFVLLGFSQPAVMTHLLDIYSKLKPRGGFEIVFVAISDDREDISSDATKQLSEMPWPAIPLYGAAGYPFTNERIEFLDSEDNAVQMQPLSIQNLLGSPQRDYLIDNDGEQVTLDYLDDKVTQFSDIMMGPRFDFPNLLARES